MPTRQVIPQQHFDTGGVTTLRITDEGNGLSDEVRRNADRAVSVNWNPQCDDGVYRRSTIGGIAPPGTAIQGYADPISATRAAKVSSFETISTHRIERRTTSARMSRVLVTLVPLIVFGFWFWYRYGL
jgi:hypothetical protein